MIARPKEFYDLLGQGLASLGFQDDGQTSALSKFIDTYFADKYNAEATMATAGFPLNPNIPLNPIYEQIEAAYRPYTIASHVDIDSDGPVKSTDGASLASGRLPVWKHQTVTARKDVYDQLLLADRLGGVDSEILNAFMKLFFNSTDKLLGGNYNTMLYLRNMIVSTCKLVIDANNNPNGIPLTIDFMDATLRKKHTTTSAWYTKDDTTGEITQAATVGASTNGIDPISIMRKIRINAQTGSEHLPSACHWECDRLTWEAILAMPYFRTFWATTKRPDITDATNKLALGNMVSDEDFKVWFEQCIGTKVVINDNQASIEKVNTTTNKVEIVDMRGFEEGTFVLVPDGDLGDSQFGRLVAIGSSAAKIAYYDGGRTMLRTVFNDDTMTYSTRSEFTGIPVPNKTHWHYFLKIKG